MKREKERGEEFKEKRKLEVYSGRAGYNSVSFTGEKYQVISRCQNSKITTEIRLKKKDKRIINILSRIPFVRSFSMIIDLIIEYWKRFLVAVIVLFLMEFLFILKSDSIFSYTISINGLEMMLGLLVIAGLIIKNSELNT